MRIYDLKQKEVINVKDCRRLGYVGDVDFDMKTGCMLALIVPGTGCIWPVRQNFCRAEARKDCGTDPVPGAGKYRSTGSSGAREGG